MVSSRYSRSGMLGTWNELNLTLPDKWDPSLRLISHGVHWHPWTSPNLTNQTLDDEDHVFLVVFLTDHYSSVFIVSPGIEKWLQYDLNQRCSARHTIVHHSNCPPMFCMKSWRRALTYTTHPYREKRSQWFDWKAIIIIQGQVQLGIGLTLFHYSDESESDANGRHKSILFPSDQFNAT